MSGSNYSIALDILQLFIYTINIVFIIVYRYETYAAPVQQTFDTVVAGTLSVLRGFTLEERAARIKDHFKVADVSCVIMIRSVL